MHAFHPRWVVVVVVVSRTPSKVSRVSEAGCDVTRIQATAGQFSWQQGLVAARGPEHRACVLAAG